MINIAYIDGASGGSGKTTAARYIAAAVDQKRMTVRVSSVQEMTLEQLERAR